MKDNVERKETGPAHLDKTNQFELTEYEYNSAIRSAHQAYDADDLAEDVDGEILALCKGQQFEAAGRLMCERMNETIVRRAKFALCLP